MNEWLLLKELMTFRNRAVLCCYFKKTFIQGPWDHILYSLG
jgi:hypothetical protein